MMEKWQQALKGLRGSKARIAGLPGNKHTRKSHAKHLLAVDTRTDRTAPPVSLPKLKFLEGPEPDAKRSTPGLRYV
jgi:hypothetical protein